MSRSLSLSMSLSFSLSMFYSPFPIFVGIFKYLNEDVSTKLYEDDESQDPGPVKVRKEHKKDKR